MPMSLTERKSQSAKLGDTHWKQGNTNMRELSLAELQSAKRTLAGMLVRVRLLAQSGDAAGCVVITRTSLRLARGGLPDDAVDDGLRLPGVALAPEFLAA